MGLRPTGRGGSEGRPRLRFVYEDRDIIVVEKPSGLPSIAPEGSRARSAYDIVTERIKSRNPRGRAAVVHRLDRGSSGVMVFAVNAEAKKVLMDNWNELVLERRYYALVEGDPQAEEGPLETWLAPAGPNRMRVAAPGERGALRASLEWRRVSQGAGYTLLDLGLETGRKHQIRVQVAALGCPIAGDEVYGARSDPAGRLMLHAHRLVLRHPRSGEVLHFESEAPPEFAEALRTPRSWGGVHPTPAPESRRPARPRGAEGKGRRPHRE